MVAVVDVSDEDPRNYVASKLVPTLAPALVALARERPADPVSWLATYLLANRPAPAVQPRGASLVIFVLGGPGSGKGTQCAKLVEKYGAAHFSAGDLLRAEVASGNERGQWIGGLIKQGAIVPAHVTIELLEAAMASRPGPYLIDGFPRSHDNLTMFEEQCGPCALTLFFDVTEETMEARLLERGKTSGRSDDNIESIKKRFKTFRDQSMPVIDLLAGRGLVAQIDASKPPDEVFATTCEHVDRVFA